MRLIIIVMPNILHIISDNYSKKINQQVRAYQIQVVNKDKIFLQRAGGQKYSLEIANDTHKNVNNWIRWIPSVQRTQKTALSDINQKNPLKDKILSFNLPNNKKYWVQRLQAKDINDLNDLNALNYLNEIYHIIKLKQFLEEIIGTMVNGWIGLKGKSPLKKADDKIYL
ncbi:hypothetical protein pb186bvf_018785 [Paramecium bursaria]